MDEMNLELMRRLSAFLNLRPAAICAGDVLSLSAGCAVSEEEAYSLLLAAELGLDIADDARDRALYGTYFPKMLRPLDADEFRADPYYSIAGALEGRMGRWELARGRRAAYEAFVAGDLKPDGRGNAIPQIGYFREEYSFPAVLEGGREWMSVTPNEIITMKEPVARSRGRVLTFGLGLGYFAYMAAMKEEVASVTVVERDPDAIALFERLILPRMDCRGKLAIVRADAFEFAGTRMAEGKYDFVFTDLWHDPSDGVDAYLGMKKLEGRSPSSEYAYWIEPTLKFYL